jgi:hypothetical protein
MSLTVHLVYVFSCFDQDDAKVKSTTPAFYAAFAGIADLPWVSWVWSVEDKRMWLNMPPKDRTDVGFDPLLS